ncbi:hypothetical protein BK022_04390 [Methylorubrum extorquens]|uniref:Uncharacterized protein n=1 Tax=Methylorubrum extorquens TaxID=408 RepID=A0A1S1P8H5_METEX|nr:hypothetical protein BK022_04390 [Methylorubrum extorquens]
MAHEMGQGDTPAHNPPAGNQHTHVSRPFKNDQRLSGGSNFYGLKTNIRQHVGCDHADKFVTLCDEDSDRPATSNHRIFL